MQDKFPEAIKTCLKTFDEVYGGDLTKPPIIDGEMGAKVKRRSTEEERQADLDEIFGDSELNTEEPSNPSISVQKPVLASPASHVYDDMLPSPLEAIPEETPESSKETDESSSVVSSEASTSEPVAPARPATLEDDPFLVSPDVQGNTPHNLFSPAEKLPGVEGHQETDSCPKDTFKTADSSSDSAVGRQTETEEEQEVDEALWSNNVSSLGAYIFTFNC
jgi:hypothetical protein